MILSGVQVVDFNFLLQSLGLTKGNLSSHMNRLESNGYVQILKSFNGKIPHTEYSLSHSGREALSNYWASLDAIRALSKNGK